MDRLVGMQRLDRRRTILLTVVVVVVYAVLWSVGRELLGTVYTPEWTARRIPWFYAPVTVLVALLSRRVLPTALSLAGFVLGVAVGELLGALLFAGQEARLDQQLAAGLEQTAQPTHPGWAIATAVFLTLTAAGAVLAWRAAAAEPEADVSGRG